MRCKAKSKQSGEQCKNTASVGFEVCHIHGGKTPVGAALPQFKTGERSKHLPSKLAAKYHEAQADPELGSLINNIALNEAFVREKLETLEEGGDAASAWTELRKQHRAMFKAYHGADPAGMELALSVMKDVIDQRLMYHQTVTEIQDTLAEQRRDLLAKSQIELKEANAVPIEQFMTFIGALVALINKVIPEKDKRAEIANGINTIISFADRNTKVS